MAEVWYAENEIGKPAAVKILNENLSRNTQIVERFHNEALVMVKLDHPNIRQVYGYGYIGNRHCIIMEYLDGDDLEALLKSGRHFTDEEVRRWWNQTVDALNYTHAMDIVHRDIKPSNLFLDKKGNIKLLDFGIAKVKESMSMTRTGMTMGTLMYMSPEQVKDPKRVGVKSDVYSLAVSFVHLLTGKPIYDNETSSEYDIQVSIVTQPVDLSSLPAAWQGFLAPYLEKDPDKRPALRHFEETAHTSPIVTPTVVQPETTPSPEPSRVATSSSEVPHNGTVSLSPEPQDKPKSKAGLWIGIGAAAVAVVVLLVMLLKPKGETEDFERYRARVEKQVADSFAMAKAQEQAEMEAQAKAEAEAKAQAEADAKAQAEAEARKKEEMANRTKIVNLVPLEKFPIQHPHLSVMVFDYGRQADISYDGKIIQIITAPGEYDELVTMYDEEMPLGFVHYYDINFDGHTDIYIGYGESRTINTLLLWNAREQKFHSESVGQNFKLYPAEKKVIEGGSNSYCWYSISLSHWEGFTRIYEEDMDIITDPAEYKNNGVEHRYTLRSAKGNGKVLCSVESREALPEVWQSIVKAYGY